ncbi:uncharacterized protein LOC126457718 isoform X2 [Schistocerca serialis cubense]|uniref:uncharacterized protein LOC126457718 isoform X2 n=1 Tax=Schistocerca serialis cubense TaxID=2023355 RepID=UPI00214E4E53|nr:uncharacterized protein LOC126457718 isoform X2 [Schistocerca serialis cubense]
MSRLLLLVLAGSNLVVFCVPHATAQDDTKPIARDDFDEFEFSDDPLAYLLLRAGGGGEEEEPDISEIFALKTFSSDGSSPDGSEGTNTEQASRKGAAAHAGLARTAAHAEARTAGKARTAHKLRTAAKARTATKKAGTAVAKAAGTHHQ